jgi:hypothetical protein
MIGITSHSSLVRRLQPLRVLWLTGIDPLLGPAPPGRRVAWPGGSPASANQVYALRLRRSPLRERGRARPQWRSKLVFTVPSPTWSGETRCGVFVFPLRSASHAVPLQARADPARSRGRPAHTLQWSYAGQRPHPGLPACRCYHRPGFQDPGRGTR